jgi:Uma2 family endonuclease
MAILTGSLSVAEFARLPQPEGGVRQELHHGELVELPPVEKIHTKLQKRLVALLESAATSSGLESDKEFPFRPEPEHQIWIADVALYHVADWERTADDDWFHGVPEIVIEVLSPSNTASEMLDRENICLRNGGKEFWLVDPNRRSVKVVRADGYSRVYFVDDAVVSDVLGRSIPAAEIFKD